MTSGWSNAGRKAGHWSSPSEPTPHGRELGLQQAFGIDGVVRPLFAAVDAAPAETLATWPDGSPAVALRAHADGRSPFVGAPVLTTELLRLAARQAGVHLFAQTDCNIHANGPFVAVHAAQDGPVELDLGCDGPVRDLLTGAALGAGPHVTLTLKQAETRVLRCGK